MTDSKTQLKGLDKGGRLEEGIRGYFLDLGFFVARGVKFVYQDFDVTDIDLWLYMRPSSLTRERTNVDIKNKRTPQAIERIFWTKGLQQALGLERSIVVTTDMRPAVREFGHATGVNVLDGVFLPRISKYQDNPHRLVEEKFLELISLDDLGKFRGDWRRRVEASKSMLLSQLDYSGCNLWLKEIAYFFEQTITQGGRREAACRSLYLNIAFLLIGLDYIFKDLSFVDNDRKNAELRDGIRYGSLGKEGMDRIIQTSMMLLESYLPNGRELATSVRWGLKNTLNQVHADILQEFFARNDVSRNLFVNARKFEEMAYAKHFTSPNSLPNELQAILGVLLDFSEVERRLFFEPFKSATSANTNNVNLTTTDEKSATIEPPHSLDESNNSDIPT